MQLTHIQPTQLIIFPKRHLFSSLAAVAVAHFLLSPAHFMAWAALSVVAPPCARTPFTSWPGAVLYTVIVVFDCQSLTP